MRIFAPTPFRYSSVDYPYGYQEIPSDTLAAAIVAAGLAFFDMPVQPQGNRLAPHLADHVALATPIIKRFPTWPANTGILLASLAASSTASRTGGTVTISATGHGVPNTYVGFRFFYPGSPSLTAGMYDSVLTIPDANTITFSAPGADFGSESINSGAAYTTATDLISLTISGNTLKDGSKVSFKALRAGTTAAIAKTLALFFGGSQICSQAPTTTPSGETGMAFRCVGSAKQVGMSNGVEFTLSASTNTVLTKDATADQTLTVRGTIAAAFDYIALWGAHLEIVP